MKPRKDDIFDQVRQQIDQQQKRFMVWKKPEFGSVKVKRAFAFSEDAFQSAFEHSRRGRGPWLVEDTITKQCWEVSVQLVSDEANKEIVRKIDTTPVLID